MLTDIFSERYEALELFKTYSRREIRFFHQSFTCLEELFPYWGSQKSDLERDKRFWKELHKRLSNELGLTWLSDAYYSSEIGLGEYRRTEFKQRAEIMICKNWMAQSPSSEAKVDEFVKERLSLIELGMRLALEEIDQKRNTMNDVTAISPKLLRQSYEARIDRYENLEAELNVRFQKAHFPLNYHNGFIQIQDDSLASSQIEKPFWSLVSDPIWENIDIDMKEAIDRRDSCGQ